MANMWLPPHEDLWKSAQWKDALSAQYELWNLSGYPLHSLDTELPRGYEPEPDTYTIEAHLVITAPTMDSDEESAFVLLPIKPEVLAAYRKRVLSEPGPTKLIELHRYVDGSVLHWMWKTVGCPNPGGEIRAKLRQLKAERKANRKKFRTEWKIKYPHPATIENTRPITPFVGLQTLAPGEYAVVTLPWFHPIFANGNRAMVSVAQERETKANAPKRKRGRPVTTFPHDHWFQGLTWRLMSRGTH